MNTSDPLWRVGYESMARASIKTPSSRGEVLVAVASVAHYAPWVRRIWIVSMDQQFRLDLFA